MIIVITGTPGVGKTNIAKRLAREMDFDYIDLNDVVKDFNLTIKTDEKRKTKVVDVEELKKTVEKMKLYNAVVDGLLGYAISCDYCVVLRCNPKKLKKRLEEKNWATSKIKENVQAEILGSITVEALEEQGWDNVYEIDTTNKKKEEVINNIKLLLEGREKFNPGKIDWLEDYKEWLDE